VYVAEGGKTHTLTFDSKGALLSRQEETPLSALPEAAQKQIQTLSTGGFWHRARIETATPRARSVDARF
jgi:hypothetical protein